MLGLFLISYPIVLSIPLTDTKDYTILCVIGVIIIGLCLYGFFSKSRSQVETTDRTISLVGPFNAKEYAVSDIAGYRIVIYRGNKSLYFYLKESDERVGLPISINGNAELLKWFSDHLTDLDEADRKKELDEIHHDAKLGDTVEERDAILALAKRVTGTLYGMGFVLGFWFLMWPKPYYLVCTLMLLFPLLPLFAPLLFKGAAKFILKNKTVYGNTAPVFLLPVMFLFINVFRWNVVDLTSFWLPFGALTLVLLALLLACSMNDEKDLKTYLAALVICAAYSAGAVIYTNGLLDHSNPTVYSSRILNKYVNHGKSTSYHLTLSAFGPVTDARSIWWAQTITTVTILVML